MDAVHYLLAGLGAGAIAGGVIGWLWGSRSRAGRPEDAPLEKELRQQIGQREADLNGLRDQLGQSQAGLARAQAERAAAEQQLTAQKLAQDEAVAGLKESQSKSLAELRDVFK